MDSGNGEWLKFLLPTLVALGLLVGFSMALTLLVWMDAGRENVRLWDEIQQIRKTEQEREDTQNEVDHAQDRRIETNRIEMEVRSEQSSLQSSD